MMNTNRSVKWQPFNAVIAGNIMVNDVLNKKNIIKKPILSDDQILDLENKICNSFANKDVIEFKFYRGGKLFKTKGIVTSIDISNKKIIINSDYSLFFSQIIEIY